MRVYSRFALLLTRSSRSFCKRLWTIYLNRRVNGEENPALICATPPEFTASAAGMLLKWHTAKPSSTALENEFKSYVWESVSDTTKAVSEHGCSRSES